MIAKIKNIFILAITCLLAIGFSFDTEDVDNIGDEEEMAAKFCVISIGIINSETIEIIAGELKETFNCEVVFEKRLKNISFAWGANRRQYFAPDILRELRKRKPPDCTRIIGIADIDIYDRGLNFIFGEASDLVCVVSMYRFKSFFKNNKSDRLAIERTVKTVIHELGHTFSLSHCDNPQCVMYFSNQVRDTDIKKKNFCKKTAWN